MALDLADDIFLLAPKRARRDRGRLAFLSGAAAEDAVQRHYERQGLTCRARRWRGAAGEIDLIFSDGVSVIFVEVKQAPTHDLAVQALQPAQVRRILAAGEQYLDGEPAGSLTDRRYDLASVDGQGRIQVIAGAFFEF